MATNAQRVRQLLGEEIPVDGSESDTLFRDDQILDLLTRAGGVEGAVAEGWRVKAGHYVDLVDTAEGTSKRAMSDLHKNALAMAAHYRGIVTRDMGVTRVHKIVRT